MSRTSSLVLLALCCALQACGGAAAGPGGAIPTNPQPAVQNDFNGNGLRVQRPTGTQDGNNGGIQVFRDTGALTGGQHGYVNAALYARSLAGQSLTSFEWASVFILDNYANAGENVAMYAQANRYSAGPTWAAVSEVTDTTGFSGQQVAHEFDVWTTGPDTGYRIGLDVFVGDSRHIRGLGRSQIVEGTAGIRVGNSEPSPYARWKRGIVLHGGMDVGIDTAGAQTPTAVRIGAGQAISMEGTDAIRMRFVGGRIQFMNGGTPVLEIDMNNGDVYKLGVLSN